MRNFTTLVFVSVLLMVSCRTESKQQLKTESIGFTKEGELTIAQPETDSVRIHLDIEIAGNEYEIQTGLMYRESMKENQGMLFIFPNSEMRYFYMKNTNPVGHHLYRQ